MRRRHGYTLIELLVACALAILVLVAIGRVVWVAENLQREVSSSYVVREDADIAFRTIQDDLRQTRLSSVRVDSLDRGVSMASPLSARDKRSFEVSPYGVAVWKSWVHYTVVADGPMTGHLVRWEAPYTAGLRDARPSPLVAWQPTGSLTDSLLPDVVLPGVGLVTGRPPEKLEELGPVPMDEGGGGFRVRFFRGDGSLSTTNPSQASDETQPGWSRAVTTLVDCRLQVAQPSDQTGRWNVYTLGFRVCPRN